MSTPRPAIPPTNVLRDHLSKEPSGSPSPSSNSPRPPPTPLLRRRSSLISFSSLEGLAGDYINPRTSNATSTREENEVTHWHSSPLIFAILPAIGGLFFKDGSAFITDFLLLALAAVFLNWSISLPWDWYYSAQAIRQHVEPSAGDVDFNDESAMDTASDSAGSSPKGQDDHKKPTRNAARGEQAAADLRRQEIWALVATFVFPVLAAYLLHVIRAQLSRPSTAVVSDYNLLIFLLAAEIRPCRQIIRLVSNRTLHLQRTVTSNDNDFLSAKSDQSEIDSLKSRLAALEARSTEQNPAAAQKTELTDLSTEMRKRYEPRLEGLERAVRRYEKRSTTLAMMMDQRLLSLETRVQDALSLAAVAARDSQHHGVLPAVVGTVTMPMRMAWNLCMWPLKAVDELYVKIKNLLLGPPPARASRRKSGRQDSEDKLREKMNGTSRKGTAVR
ncbi:uncharacterized protein RCC_07792 [Ramularia collo-cygni]|uniref:Uncharacterized protein n=1 Tax=Ramularia collo-cygni TaxID=112498 RepID=A0A2D3V5G1_9PEZI|nr:uncharacterized protein RCC_07792 [Ramularia collo-cygni]CZT21925.1 uncharacterized protein RCC_07792 [Ramularia collo-cygni]